MANTMKREKGRPKRRGPLRSAPSSPGRMFVSALLVLTLSTMGFSPSAIAVPDDPVAGASPAPAQGEPSAPGSDGFGYGSSSTDGQQAGLSGDGGASPDAPGANSREGDPADAAASDGSAGSGAIAPDVPGSAGSAPLSGPSAGGADSQPAQSASAQAPAPDGGGGSGASGASGASGGKAESAESADNADNADNAEGAGNAEGAEGAGKAAKAIEATLASSDGARYSVTVTYDEAAGIPDGTQLEIIEYVQEPDDPDWRSDPAYDGRPSKTERFASKDHLASRAAVLTTGFGMPQDGYAFFSKFLDMALTCEGEAVVPKAPVEVTIETDAVDVACADAVEVARLEYDEAVANDPQAVRGGYVTNDGKTPKPLGAVDLTYERDFETGGLAADNGMLKLRFASSELGEIALAGMVVPKGVVWQGDGLAVEVLGPAPVAASAFEAQAGGLPEERELIGAYAFSTDPWRSHGTMLWARATRVSAESGEAGALGRSGFPEDVMFHQMGEGVVAGASVSLGGEAAMLAFKAEDGFALSRLRESVDEGPADDGAQITEAQPAGFVDGEGVLQRQLPATGGGSYIVRVSYGPESGVPEGAALQVRELSGAELMTGRAQVVQALSANQVMSVRALDMAIVDPAGKRVEPAGEVGVSIALCGVPVAGDVRVVRLGGEGPELVSHRLAVLDGPAAGAAGAAGATGPAVGSIAGPGAEAAALRTLDFTTGSFSAYAIASVAEERRLVASDGTTYAVSVSYDYASGIPEGAELAVSEIKPEDEGYRAYVARSAEALGGEPGALAMSRVFDMTLKDPATGREYQPGKDVKVSIALIGDDPGAYGDVDVVHFHDGADGWAEVLDSSVDGRAVQFATGGFSVYVLAGSDGATVTPQCTYTFKVLNEEYGIYQDLGVAFDNGNGSADVRYEQTVKSADELIVPQPPYQADKVFAGWYENKNAAGAFEPEDEPYDFNGIVITENGAVELYAVYRDYATVVFHGQYDAERGGFPVVATRRAELVAGTDGATGDETMSATATVRIDDVSASHANDGTSRAMGFYGWSRTPVTVPGASHDDDGNSVSVIDGGEVIVDEATTVHLYPVFKGVRQLTYYAAQTGLSAAYVSPVAVFEGEAVPSPLPVTSRDGYTFEGWWTGTLQTETVGGETVETVNYGTQITYGDGRLCAHADDPGMYIDSVDGTLRLRSDATLFAKWKADCRIVLWRQKTTDGLGLPEDRKSYEYAGVRVVPAEIGSELEVPGECRSLGGAGDYAGYELGHFDQPTVVGNAKDVTTLNVYYDLSSAYDPSGQEHRLAFADSVEAGEGASDMPSAVSLAYGAPLAGHVPPDPVSARTSEGGDAIYSFAGWFADPECTVPVDLESMVMPDHDLTVYAGWEGVKHRVQIDPNYGSLYRYEGGALEGTGATWFNSTYDAEPIGEYTHVTRDYVESSTSGTWYYVKHDLAYYGGSSGPDRKTYYTQDPAEATEDTTFEYAPGTYSYAGWYEVFADGSEAAQPYDFSQHTDHATTLRLHWKKGGSYYLAYAAGDGSFSGTRDKELFADGFYEDGSSVVLTASATAPQGRTFVGWRVRGAEGGAVYAAGQALTLNADDAVRASGRDVVFLDAVYEKMGTASIVYDANGGTVDASAYGDGNTYVDVEAGTVRVSGLEGNAAVDLDDGGRFSRAGAEFLGWSNKPVYDPDDETAALFAPGSGETYAVDAKEPSTLYAVWGVDVTYHLNNGAASWGADAWDAGVYKFDGSADGNAGTYTQTVYLGRDGGTFAEPRYAPAYGGTNEAESRFCFWTWPQGSTEAYDFSEPIAAPRDLFAYWAGPVEIPVHAVDASAQALADKDAAWVADGAAVPVATEIAVDEALARRSLQGGALPAGFDEAYAFAFAAVHDPASGIASISEDEEVSSLRYDAEEKRVYARFADGGERPLREGADEVYFVFYQKKALSIAYRTMGPDGLLHDAASAVDDDAPESTGALPLGEYDMADGVTRPLTWMSDGQYAYYAYAIGDQVAPNASALSFITATASSEADGSRPQLSVRNGWRGFEYSPDGGATWVKCGFEPRLYVAYYTQLPTVAQVHERTVGTSAVMGTEFTFDYKVEQIERTTTSVQRQVWDPDATAWSDSGEPSVSTSEDTTVVFDTTAPENGSFTLKNGEADTSILFYAETRGETAGAGYDDGGASCRDVTTVVAVTSQRVTFTQRAQAGFSTEVNDVAQGPAETYQWSCESNGDGGTRDVVFANKHDALAVEVHVALVEEDGVFLRDDLRAGGEDASACSLDVALGATVLLPEGLPAEGLFAGDASTYAFGAVISGASSGANGSRIDVDRMDIGSLAYGHPSSAADNVHELLLGDVEGSEAGELGNRQLFYLYYPMPVIEYVKRNANGSLTRVAGSYVDDVSGLPVATGDITYSRGPLVMNEREVVAGQRLAIAQGGTVIGQTGSASFRMPPVLDDGVYERYLVYSYIGAGAGGIAAFDELDKSAGLSMYLQVKDNALQYSFDKADWRDLPLSGAPTIYAVYTERGYDLQLTKTASAPAGFSGDPAFFTDKPFGVKLSSFAITEESYDVEGMDNAIIQATPATGAEPGFIELDVKDGTAVKIMRLGQGDYTVVEEGGDNYELSAKMGPLLGGTATSLEVADGTTIALKLEAATRLDLVNSPKRLCKINDAGSDHVFYTLGTAMKYVEDNMASRTATIEMLSDYLMPAADALEVPSGFDITLTTAASGFSGAGQLATVARSQELAGGPLFVNGGSLTFRNITIDGAGVEASAPLVQSSGNVAVAGGAALQNAVNATGNGGAINATGGDVSVDSGTVSNNRAVNGGALYYSGNGTISVDGTGRVTGNAATGADGAEGDGGAIYATGGTVSISGSALSAVSNNRAENGKGGAVYAGGVVMRIGGNGSIAGNRAQEGGALYVQSGTVDVSMSSSVASAGLSGNVATAGNGGALWLGTGSVSVAGGNLLGNVATAGDGGAIYAEGASVSVSGGAIGTADSPNVALSGGAVFAVAGTVSVSGGSLSGNAATAGNGGAIYAGSGALSVTGGSIAANSASRAQDDDAGATGNGGAVYAGTGAVTLNGADMSGNSADGGMGGAVYAGAGALSMANSLLSGNSAVNGSALFVASGTARFENGAQASSNAASVGGAVGVGASTVRLNFSGNVQIAGNVAGAGDGASPSNVFLDQDADTVINSSGLGAEAAIGVRVAISPEALFANRGVPGAKFASYTSDANCGRFFNDATPSLVAMVGVNNKVIWGNALQVQVRYVASFAGGFPPEQAGERAYPESGFAEYYPQASQNGASAIAADLYDKVSAAHSGAGFACAFADGADSFDDYVTAVNWDAASGSWTFVKRDGSVLDAAQHGGKLVVYFAEPSYVDVENNTEYPLELTELAVLGHSAFNSGESAGYGYVVAVNGVTQESLVPVTAQDLSLAAGKSIRLLFPGANGQGYSFAARFAGASSDIPLRRTGEADESLPAQQANEGFSRSGAVASASGGTTEVVFGGDRPICKITTGELAGVALGEIAGKTEEPDANGNVEYVFSSMNQAVSFAQSHGLTQTAIEMLVDYLMPRSDVVVVPNGYDITFTTATSGAYRYDGARATISRDADNLVSFILAGGSYDRNGRMQLAANQDYGTAVTVDNLSFDGKALVGSGDGGAIMAYNVKTAVSNADFSNFTAGNGGAIYVQYGLKNGGTEYSVQDDERLAFEAVDVNFRNCISSSEKNRQGGGAIWTNAKTLVVSGDGETTGIFDSCSAFDQGGAVFHCIDGGIADGTWTRLTGCSFSNCEARAAGAIETDAANVRAEGCAFRQCKASMRNGGAFNVYSRNAESTPEQSVVTVIGCSFEDCHADSTSQSNNHGGGLRSAALETYVWDCVFENTSSLNGGAIGISNANATVAEILGCAINDSRALRKGGGVYCTAKRVVVGDYVAEGRDPVSTTISNATAVEEGGGMYHSRLAGESVTLTNATIAGCSSTTRGGGGLYADTPLLKLVDVTVQNCTAAVAGGGVQYGTTSNRQSRQMVVRGCTITGNSAGDSGGGIMANAARLSVRDGADDAGAEIGRTLVSNCVAAGPGGGVYHASGAGADSAMALENWDVSGCASADAGGGVHTNALAVSLLECTVAANTASGNGGGLYSATGGAGVTLDSCSVQRNASGSKGGGVFAASSVTLLNTGITDNRLSGSAAENAGGMWLENSRTLTIGAPGQDASDSTAISGNTAGSGAPSNLRLPETGTGGNAVNSNSVVVNCSLTGKVYVVNARKQGTQFGTSPNSTSAWRPGGFLGDPYAFEADDKSLHGIFDRLDDSGKKIIWGGDPICKITDGAGRLLYFKVSDGGALMPAVFDQLDNGGDGASNTGAFALLKNKKDDLRLFYPDGASAVPASGEAVYCVKMLVEEYTATNYITMNRENATLSTSSNSPWMRIVLTTETATEPTDDDPYCYRGRAGTRSTIKRAPSMNTGKSMITANVSISLQSIVLDGGSNEGVKTSVSGSIINNAGGSNYNRYVTIEVGPNSLLQNGSTSASGGAIYLNYGNCVISGGVIRNCSAGANGGGVWMNSSYKTDTVERGSMRFQSGGIIMQCKAKNGGGIYVDNNARLQMSGGTISGCEAESGGGLFVANTDTKYPFIMSGGEITANHATVKAGGIGVSGGNARLNFSGRVRVSDNTCDTSKAAGNACNVRLDQDSRAIVNAVDGGLYAGSYIGVYVPDGPALFDKHGQKNQDFGTFATGANKATLYSFVNDRNKLKGGIIDGVQAQSNAIYWIQIFSLEVSKSVTAGEGVYVDPDEQFAFRVRLWGEASSSGQPDAKDIDSADGSGYYGDMPFTSNGIDGTTATFKLAPGESVTAVNLSDGLRYEVIEELTDVQGQRYAAMPSDAFSGVVGENKDELTGDPYTSFVHVENMLPTCKITDGNGNLLYRHYGDGTGGGPDAPVVPALFTELSGDGGAFQALQDGGLLQGNGAGGYVGYSVDNGVQVQMLVSSYAQREPITVGAEVQKATLTTASPSAPQFPYQGLGALSTVRRSYDGDSLFEVQGGLTFGGIILDGARASAGRVANADGGIANVAAGGSLSIQGNASLQYSRTSQRGGALFVAAGGRVVMSGGEVRDNESAGDGAGIYLAEGAMLSISGSPGFGGTGLDLGGNIENSGGNYRDGELDDVTNGFASYTRARQDVFLEGYADANAASLSVAGPISAADGTIWVWADAAPHYTQNEQFAQIAGSDPGNLAAFRNARDDVASDNETDMYLYGVEGDGGSVIWSGNVGGRVVVLQKVDAANRESLAGAEFALYRGNSATPYVARSPEGERRALSGLQSLPNGTIWVGELPRGTYCLEETRAPSAPGYSSNKGAWFRLDVTDAEATMSGPLPSRPVI